MVQWSAYFKHCKSTVRRRSSPVYNLTYGMWSCRKTGHSSRGGGNKKTVLCNVYEYHFYPCCVVTRQSCLFASLIKSLAFEDKMEAFFIHEISSIKCWFDWTNISAVAEPIWTFARFQLMNCHSNNEYLMYSHSKNRKFWWVTTQRILIYH